MKSVVLVVLPLLGLVHGHPKGHKACPTITVTVTKTREPSSDPSCSICSDLFDDCGNTYGPGCYDSCKTPSPTYTTPECTLTTPTGTDLPSTCTRTLCVDYIDDCGQLYGTCYNDCLPEPSITKPPCTPSSTPASRTDTWPASCSMTICADYVNDCGQWYGGCYNECDTPTFTTPSCEATSTPTATETCTITVCIDGITPCGDGFGGCFPACDGIPTDQISTPSCSLTGYPTPPATTYYR